MSEWFHAIACVVGPAAWGVCVYFAFEALERRRRRLKRDDMPPIDYSI